MKPLLNTAVTGNGRMLVTFDSYGGVSRLFWPNIDLNQHIDSTWAALECPLLGEQAVRLDDPDNWIHRQEYLTDSSVLTTSCVTRDHSLEVQVTDFVPWDRDILIRSFEVRNLSAGPVPAVLLYYNSLYIDNSSIHNAVLFDTAAEALLHYRHDKWFAVAGEQGPTGFQSGETHSGQISSKLSGNPMSMGTSGSQSWDLGEIPPGQSRCFSVYITAGFSKDKVLENVGLARNYGSDKFLQETKKFWETYLRQGYKLDTCRQDIKQLFNTSLIMCKLLMNRDSGGIIAAPEFDETYSHCGGYGYCWGRDGAYIAHAMLKAGYPEYARSFYHWTIAHQNPAGDWPQRQFTNGFPAPVWGDQIDETGTILWGMCQYYKETWDSEFLEEVWPTVSRAADFLLRALNSETGLPEMSFDLWEERFGEHAYSAAAVYAGLKGAGQIAGKLNYSEQGIKWLEAAMKLKEKMLAYFWDDDLNRFIRSRWVKTDYNEFLNRSSEGKPVKKVSGPGSVAQYYVFGDSNPDASLIGLSYPFGVIAPGDSRMQATVANSAASLTNPVTDGIGRYCKDCYAGGNPWVITTLWHGLYRAATGEWQQAKSCLEWALQRKNQLGLLPEQVDRKTGEPAWVIPLTWSHAMFLLLSVMLSEANKL